MKETTLPLHIVTKSSSSGDIRRGDHIYWCDDGGSLVCLEAAGWLDPEDITEEIRDFEAVIDPEKEVSHSNRGYFVVNRN